MSDKQYEIRMEKHDKAKSDRDLIFNNSNWRLFSKQPIERSSNILCPVRHMSEEFQEIRKKSMCSQFKTDLGPDYIC